MAKTKSHFVCQACGQHSPRWVGRCTECGEWNSFVEEAETPRTLAAPGRRAQPVRLAEIAMEEDERRPIGISEMDRVLGGGLVHGSVTLIGGDPGIGKSTLLLQIAGLLGSQDSRALYVSGEESLRQIKLRADRLGVDAPELTLLAENSLEQIVAVVSEIRPAVLIIDSVQTVYTESIHSAPGSVSQVREAAGLLTAMAKRENISLFLIGHVTKDGSIAGPRVLEHMVDTVLYFEGDRGHTYRILRTMKNRFGSTQEVGVFQMKENGLAEVANPSEIFLAERPADVAGSAVVASLEGTRPILVEIQALVCPVEYGVPRRMTTGVDRNRVNLLVAVLEKRVGTPLSSQDIFVNVVGGMTLCEPAADLAILSAVMSNHRGRPIDAKTLLFGEVGLGGEIRAVSRPQARLREGAKLGFRRCILPQRCAAEVEPAGLEVVGVRSVDDLIEIFFG